MKQYRFVCVFLCLIQLGDSTVQMDKVSEDMEIHKCIVRIIERIELFNTTDVTLINVNESLANELHTFLPHPVRFISRSFYWPNNTLFNYVYLIQCDNFFMFALGLDLIKRDPLWNPKAKFVIIVEFIDDFLQDVSDFLIHNHIYDVAVVAYDKDQSVVVYTFSLDRDECDRPSLKTLQLLSRCSAIDNIDQIFIRTRKTSLRGCRVKFVAHNYYPFVSFSSNDGIEQNLIKLIQQYENITVEVIEFGKNESFGYRLNNFTYTDMLHEVEIYTVEGAMGGYVLNLNRMSNLDFIYPFMVDHQTVVISRAKLLGKWYGVLKHLGVLTLWSIIGTFGIFCITVILMKIFQRRERDTSRDILMAWGYFLGNINPNYKLKSAVPHRFVLLSILLHVYIVSCAIQASLLSVTTHPIRDDQPNLVEEVFSNYQLLISPNYYGYLRSNHALNVTNALTTCKSNLDCMIEIMNNPDKRLFTIASDIYHEGNIWKFADENGELKIHKIKESAGTVLQTMYVHRGSSLVEPFNRLLLRATAGGLIVNFVNRIHFKERVKYNFHGRKKKPQSLKGLLGVYLVLIGGYSLCLIILIIEYYLYKIHKLAT